MFFGETTTTSHQDPIARDDARIQKGWVNDAQQLAKLNGDNEEGTTDHNQVTLLDRMQEEWKDQADRLSAYEHSLESDTDLVNFLDHLPKSPNKIFMDKESHRHDSLWNEIEHAIDTDPDLASIVAGKGGGDAVNQDFMEHEKHRHDSLLDEVQHAMENDPDLDGLMAK